MNKRKVEKLLPIALDALNDPNCRIIENNKIDKGFRSQISSFGAAITMGSFKAAVAFFGKKGGSNVERENLLRAVYYISNYDANASANNWKSAEDIVKEILTVPEQSIPRLKESFINSSIALKLALNAFDLE